VLLQVAAAHEYLSPAALQEVQQYLYLGALRKQQPVSSGSQALTPQIVAAEYLAGLQQSATTAAASTKQKTQQAAMRHWTEFENWMNARRMFTGRDAWDATPEDLLVYMETEWLQHHGELLLQDGQLHASPGYVRSTLSHLSSIFILEGRERPWDPTTLGSPGRPEYVS
jgi:hypothetical protein